MSCTRANIPGRSLSCGFATRACEHRARLLVDRGLDRVDLAGEARLRECVDRHAHREAGLELREVGLGHAEIELELVDLLEARDVGAGGDVSPSLTWRRPATPANGARISLFASFASSSLCLARARV